MQQNKYGIRPRKNFKDRYLFKYVIKKNFYFT